MKNCSECGAVYLGKKINHWEHCSKWDGIKGRVVKVSSAHVDKGDRMEDKVIADELKRLIKRINDLAYQATNENQLRVDIKAVDFNVFGLRNKVPLINCDIYKEV